MLGSDKGYTPIYLDERSSSSLDEVESERQIPSDKISWFRRCRELIIHAALIATYTVVFVVSMRNNNQPKASVFGLVDCELPV